MSVAKDVQLVVFADDWGRHPSSCQHLVRHLLPRHRTLWVNTIGTRSPKMARGDMQKVVKKLGAWFIGNSQDDLPFHLQVTNPRMYPGFRRRWQRGINARSIARTVNEQIRRTAGNCTRVAITTLPIAADVVGRLDVDRWIYYCVDDFSSWPGLDGNVMRVMEDELLQKVDAVVAVSPALQQRAIDAGKDAILMTHGIDLAHWWGAERSIRLKGQSSLLFWGLIDGRMDVSWCEAARSLPGTVLNLFGPRDDTADPRLWEMPHVYDGDAVPYEDLPCFAAAADVLVMPYIDAPVTRAMQPLKFKEYLATGKPVVARRLPGITDWADAADLVDDAESFVDALKLRLREGMPASQDQARKRLVNETWEHKAATFERIILNEGPVVVETATEDALRAVA